MTRLTKTHISFSQSNAASSRRDPVPGVGEAGWFRAGAAEQDALGGRQLAGTLPGLPRFLQARRCATW